MTPDGNVDLDQQFLFNIVSVNGLSPVQWQAIYWINAVLSVELLRANLKGKFQSAEIFYQKNALENAVCKMLVI